MVEAAKMAEAEMMQVRQSLQDMMERTQQALAKFEAGSSQHSLLENRLQALRVGLWLIEDTVKEHTRNELEQAVAPVNSLMQKSGKAREKVKPGSWQHAMLSNNLQALAIVKKMLETRLDAGAPGNLALTAEVEAFFAGTPACRKEPESHA